MRGTQQWPLSPSFFLSLSFFLSEAETLCTFFFLFISNLTGLITTILLAPVKR